MSQRVRKNGSPTSTCLSMSSSTAVAGVGTTTGGSGTSVGNPGLISRLLPMKATVPFQLKPQTQPPLLTRSVQGTASGGSSPTHTGNGKFHSSGYSTGEAPGTRTTSASRSPTHGVVNSSTVPGASPADISLSSPSHACPAVGLAGTGSPSSRTSPANTTSAAGTNPSSGTVRAAVTQSPLSVAASPPSVSPAPHINIHSYGFTNVSSSGSLGISPLSPCCSPIQHPPWLSDYPNLTTSSLLLRPSASSPSSFTSSSIGVPRAKAVSLAAPQRWSPGLEQERLSPERISPGWSDGEKPRPPPTTGLTSSGIRRASSLDLLLTAPYLAGHWPRECQHGPFQPCMRDKSTQTPGTWAEEGVENTRGPHQRSASWGSTDQLKEIAKLRQQLQRSKHSSRHHRDKERKSPFNGNHVTIHQSQAPVPRTVLIPISKSSVSRFRNSVEGLNQEIERIIVRDVGEKDELPPHDVPDGRRAPPPHPQRPSSPPNLSQHCSSSASRSINTQTPSGGVSNRSSSSSESVSPTFLTVPTEMDSLGGRGGDVGGDWHCNEELLTDCGEKDLGSSSPLPKYASSPLPKYASSPKPNNSYMFKREPPEGCERVKVFTEETQSKPPQLVPQFLRGPDRNKVNFIPNSGSAFCLVSILKPLLPTPTQEVSLKSPGAGPNLTLEPEEQKVSIGTSPSTFSQHLEDSNS
ncbi:protein FAM117B isoform X1 [Esox lucius]|uniref:Family with sequence similarity 117 member Ba n=2 Tax=Esox lucius TaxID=8010 RepID=A0A3P8Y3J3_ESOLU|nr:protein FAM117B isoform X1 [Esox lucius]